MILGSGFSPAFAEVIYLTDALILLIVLLAIFLERIVALCAAALHRASSALAFLVAHISMRL